MHSKSLVAIVLSGLLLFSQMSMAGSPSVVGKLNLKGRVEINGVVTPTHSTVFAGDRISTGEDTALGLSMGGGDQLFLPSLSTAAVDRAGQNVIISLQRGALAVINQSGQPILGGGG